MVMEPVARCPDCGSESLAVSGTLDYGMSELGPDCVRHDFCFGCGWARYESGRVERAIPIVPIGPE